LCGRDPSELGTKEITRAVIESVAENTSDATVLRGYGSTETLGVANNRPDDPIDRRINLDGVPIQHVEVELRDPEGQPVAHGSSGEVFVRGPNTWPQPPAEARRPVRTGARQTDQRPSSAT
jgi:acyl-CoA synthetase (AMP-forming)/AMP-acid ligase II